MCGSLISWYGHVVWLANNVDGTSPGVMIGQQMMAVKSSNIKLVISEHHSHAAGGSAGLLAATVRQPQPSSPPSSS